MRWNQSTIQMNLINSNKENSASVLVTANLLYSLKNPLSDHPLTTRINVAMLLLLSKKSE